VEVVGPLIEAEGREAHAGFWGQASDNESTG